MLRYRLTYLLVLAVTFLYCVFDSGYLSFAAFLAVLLLPVLSFAFLPAAAGNIQAEARAKQPAVEREGEAVFEIRMANPSVFPLSVVQMRLRFENQLMGETREETVFLPMGFRSEQTVRCPLQSRHCGKLEAEVLSLRAYDTLGLFSRRLRAGQRAFLLATPPTRVLLPPGNFAARPGKESAGEICTRPGSDPTEVFDIRPFREADTMRSIHWKLSMKLDTLIAKEFSLPAEIAVSLILELQADDPKTLDIMVETLFSLSYMLLFQGTDHRVEWYDAAARRQNQLGVSTDDEFSAMTLAILSSKRYGEEPCFLLCRGEGGHFADCPCAIYITGRLTQALSAFCCRAGGEKTTVIRCGQPDEEERALVKKLSLADVTFLAVLPDDTGELMFGPII